MSRRPAKARAAIGRTSAFGAFSSPATSTGSLSYLSEPPDLSSISDPNVVVSFKNLLKKDGTTKSKALEDLISYVEAHPFDREGGTEEPVLEAWVGCDCFQPLNMDGVVMVYITGPTISSYLNRQLSPCARAISHSAAGIDEVGPQTHGKAYT